MATVYPTATGNYSTRTWNDDATGAAYGPGTPQTGDTILANGMTITIDQNVTVVAIATTAGTTAAAGGGFNLGSYTLNANITSGTTVCLTVTAGADAVINGNVQGSTTTANMHGVVFSTGTLLFAGNATGGTSPTIGISITSTGVFTMTSGTLNGGSTSNSPGLNIAAGTGHTITAAIGNTSRAVNVQAGSATLTVTSFGGAAINCGGSGHLQVVGDVTVNSATFTQNSTAQSLWITGNFTHTGSGNGISFLNGVVRIDGRVTSTGTGTAVNIGASNSPAVLYVGNGVTAGTSGNGVTFNSVSGAQAVVIKGTVTGGSTTGIGVSNIGPGQVLIFGSTVNSGGNATSNTGSGSVTVVPQGGLGFIPSMAGGFAE